MNIQSVGDRIRAIKCLVRSGDTKAVIQFATISRNAEIYTLAANYLQQMNWRESVDIMKAIIMFYTKAKSWEQLARFYDSCALVEIDEYRDYEKVFWCLNVYNEPKFRTVCASALKYKILNLFCWLCSRVLNIMFRRWTL